MADAVTSQTLVDGPKNLIMKFTNVSDGTGESAVLKVDVSTFPSALGVPTGVSIDRIQASTSGMAVRILWDATSDVDCFLVPTDELVDLDFNFFSGLQNNSGAGKTGDINFTTIGHTSGDVYTVVLYMSKQY